MSGYGIAANVSARSDRRLTAKGQHFAARKSKARESDLAKGTAPQQATLKKRRTVTARITTPASAPAPKPVTNSVRFVLNPPAVFHAAQAQVAADATRLLNPIRIPADVLQRDALSPVTGRLLNLDTLPPKTSAPLLLSQEDILAMQQGLTLPPLSPFSEVFPEMETARPLSPFSILEAESELTTSNHQVELPSKNAPTNNTQRVAAAAAQPGPANPTPGPYDFDSLTGLLDGIDEADSPKPFRPKPVTPQPAPATAADPVEDIFDMGPQTGSPTVFKTLAQSAAEQPKAPLQITPGMVSELELL